MKHFLLHRYGPLLLCGLLLVTGGQTRADDLVSVYQLALDADPQYQAAVEAHKAALEAGPQSRAALLPNIGLSGDVSRNRFDPREQWRHHLFHQSNLQCRAAPGTLPAGTLAPAGTGRQPCCTGRCRTACCTAGPVIAGLHALLPGPGRTGQPGICRGGQGGHCPHPGTGAAAL